MYCFDVSCAGCEVPSGPNGSCWANFAIELGKANLQFFRKDVITILKVYMRAGRSSVAPMGMAGPVLPLNRPKSNL
jgi:hypothetical protein